MLASRHIKREKASVPVNVRRSKTSLLKFPNTERGRLGSSFIQEWPTLSEQAVFLRHEAFSLFICLDANKFLLLISFFLLIKTIYPRVSTKPLPNDAKIPLPVDVRGSKTLLLKLPC